MNAQMKYQFLDRPAGDHRTQQGAALNEFEHFSSYFDSQSPDSIGAEALSIALIGPDEQRRKEQPPPLLPVPWKRGPRVFGLSCQPGRCATPAGAAPRRHHHRPGQQSGVRPGAGGEHLRQRVGDGDGLLVEARPGPAGALHARRRPRVPDPAVCAQHHGRSAGAGAVAPSGRAPAAKDGRTAAGFSGRQGRSRCDHSWRATLLLRWPRSQDRALC